MRFPTEISLAGPLRSPAQMLAAQEIDGHASVHDPKTAASLGLVGAPIEAPTHFSQFDPLAVLVWGSDWFAHGCISSHFRTMVVEGEQVQATLTTSGSGPAPIEAHKEDGTPVLIGTASLGPDYGDTELEVRRAGLTQPGELFIIDQLQVGMKLGGETVSMSFTERNGPLYPFSLAEKLARITEAHPWYTPEGAKSSPWGRPIIPMEMISVLAHKSEAEWPLRGPALTLFLDLEVRLLRGPVLVDHEYRVDREVVGLSESRRTESYWTRTTLTDAGTGQPVAQILLHSGLFKDSFAGYPADRLVV
jgi:hypothetical protein